MTNTLSYCDTEIFTAGNSLIVQTPRRKYSLLAKLLPPQSCVVLYKNILGFLILKEDEFELRFGIFIRQQQKTIRGNFFKARTIKLSAGVIDSTS